MHLSTKIQLCEKLQVTETNHAHIIWMKTPLVTTQAQHIKTPYQLYASVIYYWEVVMYRT